jgi:hypothetical protein
VLDKLGDEEVVMPSQNKFKKVIKRNIDSNDALNIDRPSGPACQFATDNQLKYETDNSGFFV